MTVTQAIPRWTQVQEQPQAGVAAEERLARGRRFTRSEPAAATT
jgi:hypothetical protein